MTQSSRIFGTTQKPAATNTRKLRNFLLMQQFAAQEIGARIAQARKERGLTQEQLAEIGPFSKRSLQDYESGLTIPYKHLRDLARLLRRPEEWFLYGDPPVVEGRAEDMYAQLVRIEQALQVLIARLSPPEQEGQNQGH